MPTITPADVIDVAPELGSVDPARFQRIIDMVTPQVSDDVFGIDAKLAACLLVAHRLTMMGIGGRGPVTSETVGDVSRGYAGPEQGDNLTATAYGRQYKEIRDANVFSPLVS